MAVFSDLGGLFFHSCWDCMAYPSMARTHFQALSLSLSPPLPLSRAHLDTYSGTLLEMILCSCWHGLSKQCGDSSLSCFFVLFFFWKSVKSGMDFSEYLCSKTENQPFCDVMTSLTQLTAALPGFSLSWKCLDLQTDAWTYWSLSVSTETRGTSMHA